MAYTVKEVAALSGVSVRTLHYYDEIGLLKPASVGENGYRYYEEEQLLRLQQILFFRELDLPLGEIQELLASDAFNQMEALHQHKHLLQQKADRLSELMRTIDKTIEYLKGETEMSNEEIYYGFDKEQQEKYVQDLKDRYGKQVEPHIEESQKRMKNWKKSDYDEVSAHYNQINQELVVHQLAGKDVSAPEVQEIIKRHFAIINRFYTPTKEVYSGLGDLYCDHPDFRKLYDAVHPQFAEYLRDAMKYYAENELS